MSQAQDSATQAERIYLRLVADYQSAILNYLYRMVGDAELAEDLCQDTFVRAYRALPRLELGEAAAARRRAWLYRIAHNLATDHLRRRARLRWLPLAALRKGDGPAHLRGQDPAERSESGDAVRRALDRLPQDQRHLLLLFNHLDMAAAEVAEILDISEAAARKRRQRASQAFRAAYLELAAEGLGDPALDEALQDAEAGPTGPDACPRDASAALAESAASEGDALFESAKPEGGAA